jgi:hypothetical protein
MSQNISKQNRPELKDSLFLGFCAVFIIVTRVALRLHLKIPGHAMFFTLFFLFLARGCVRYRFSATFTGLVAGLIAIVLGLGKGGPLIMIKFIMPALVIDISALLLPGLFSSFILCAIVGALASATMFFNTYLIDYLAGMDTELIFAHAMIKSVSSIAFGVAASLFIPSVIRKLKAFGVI